MNRTEMREVETGQRLIHKRTEKIYTVILKGKVKISGTWEQAITYTPANPAYFLQIVYTRVLDDFEGFEVLYD